MINTLRAEGSLVGFSAADTLRDEEEGYGPSRWRAGASLPILGRRVLCGVVSFSAVL